MSGEIWFTSDTHFSHNRIQAFCPHTRYQGSLEEHDELLIKNWNKCVKKGDRIYHLGDFSFANVTRTEEIIQQLNGDIHLIYGNHDQRLREPKFEKYFKSRQDYKTIRVDNTKVVMFHFPIHEWDQCHRDSFHLFGHVHAGFRTLHGKSLNVGIDARFDGDMMPWNWEEIKLYMENKPSLAHH